MMRNHLANFFSHHENLLNQDSYAVAVSGGPDSMALAHMLIEYSKQHNKKCHLLTVDHGLRAESKDEMINISQWAAIQDVPHHALVWEGDKPNSAIMEAARHARYKIMADKCAELGVSKLFVAHHQGDQAETFLIRLTKGSGLDGLAAMTALYSYNDDLSLVRPLLNVSKSDLISYCERYNIPYVQDPSNKNNDYLRPRLRASMDVLEQEGLSVKRLARTASRIARARQALEEITKNVFQTCLIENDKNKYVFDFLILKRSPEEIGLRVIQKALEEMRPKAEYRTRMEKLEELFAELWFSPESFKPRTLGRCIFLLKGDKDGKNLALYIEKEKG